MSIRDRHGSGLKPLMERKIRGESSVLLYWEEKKGRCLSKQQFGAL